MSSSGSDDEASRKKKRLKKKLKKEKKKQKKLKKLRKKEKKRTRNEDASSSDEPKLVLELFVVVPSKESAQTMVRKKQTHTPVTPFYLYLVGATKHQPPNHVITMNQSYTQNTVLITQTSSLGGYRLPLSSPGRFHVQVNFKSAGYSVRKC
jgi:hypothetical protein